MISITSVILISRNVTIFYITLNFITIIMDYCKGIRTCYIHT
ncbi:hypothetical protein SLEP1_g24531 [Rubroshorea leprosula]|uniref:Uncharacterized protein n=1 Tax=Rubroshorea leprosula TaxID=152421 RepID=A0AAV5JNA5_9ROSI|nr:hypothetical protein SLEP1_g24531 [Rubroshorea leprosula]